jgi:N-methylhydantoinase B
MQRDPAAVADDVRNGYVSAEAAEREYGVVLGRQVMVD